MESITSRSNPLCAHLRKLAASAAHRRESGEFLCDSPKLLEEVLLWRRELLRTVLCTDPGKLPELPEGMSLAEFRKAVIQERALELAFEGNRLYDLRRTASVTATVPEATKLSEEQAAFYPIPQRELDLNPNVK